MINYKLSRLKFLVSNFLVFSFLLLMIACSEPVIISEYRLPYDGRGTQGALIVTKGDLVDTIYDCHYGVIPEYEILNYNGNQFLYSNCEMNGGGDNVKTFFIWSLESKNFMDTLFYKQIYTSEVSSTHANYFDYGIWTQREANFKFQGKNIVFTIDSLITKTDYDTNENIDTISKGFKSYLFEF